MQRLHNPTIGGNIVVQNASIISFLNDTLKSNVSIIDYASGTTDAIRFNHITGNLNFIERLGNTGNTHSRGNYINGNTSITTTSGGQLLTEYQDADTFIGNVSIQLQGSG